MPESNPALVLFVSVKNWLTLRPLRLIIIPVKRLSEGPYLKSFIRRVLCFDDRERFSSYQASVIRLPVAPYFLTVLHSAVRTKAVKHFWYFPMTVCRIILSSCFFNLITSPALLLHHPTRDTNRSIIVGGGSRSSSSNYSS